MKIILIVLASISLTLAIVFGLHYGWNYAYDKGIKAGINGYHKQCIPGGYIVGEDGSVVGCQFLGKLPPEDALKKESEKQL
jgi:hypothetical protein